MKMNNIHRSKTILVFMFLALLMLPLIVAEDLEVKSIPTEPIEDKAGWSLDNIYSFDKTDMKYGKVEITNSFLWFLPTGKLEDITLTDNTDVCGIDCSATKEITTYTDTKLVDSVKFLRLMDDGKWVESNIRNYQFYIKSKSVPYEVNDYKEVCEDDEVLPNGTISKNCKSEISGTHTEYTEEWIPYNYEVMPAGTYTLKLEGQKRPDWTYDWVITSQGKEITEWSTWGGTTGSTLIESFTGTPDDYYAWGTTVSYRLGQQFTIGTTGLNQTTSMNKISMLIYKENTPTTCSVCIMEGGSTTSMGTILACNNSVGVAGVTTNTAGEWFNISIPQVTLTKGATYWINASNCDVDQMRWKGDSSSPSYTGGSSFVAYSGSYRTDLDFDFMVWMTGADSSITLNSPADGYISPTNSVTFNATASVGGGATLTNMSLFDNSTGNWILNKSIIMGAGITTNTSTFTNSYPNAQNVLWGIQACDSDGACGFSENRTVYIETFAGGDGTPANPYQVTSWTNLNIVRNNLTASYILNNNLNSTTSGYAGIGNDWETISTIWSSPFTGTFNGQGYSISDLIINKTGQQEVGFFGNLQTGNVSNLQLINVNISGGREVGGLIGYLISGRIDNCSVKGITNIRGYTDGEVGGLVGWFQTGTMINSYTLINGSLIGSDEVGTLIGRSVFGTITNCQSIVETTSNISSTSATNKVGFIGNIGGAEVITNPYLTIRNSTYNSNITFTQLITYVTGKANLLSYITIGNNSVSVNSTQTALNKSANVTLWGLPSFSNPKVIKDGAITPCPSSICTLQSYSSGTAKFSVTGWTNYSIGENPYDRFFFGPCNATSTLKVLNLTFIDETTGLAMNATMDASSWSYTLVDSTKTFIFSNTTHNKNYDFCITPNYYSSFQSTETLQYSEAVDGTYPQRIVTFTNETLFNNSLTTKVLYLLAYTNGVTSNYQVISVGNQVIQGAHITVSRVINGNLTLISDGYTDASGQLSFFLNPNYEHTFVVTATGYSQQTITIRPSQAQYTITMGGASNPFLVTNIMEGISYVKWPASGPIQNKGSYNYTFLTSATSNLIYNCSFYIYYPNGTLLTSAFGCNATSPGTGGIISAMVNVTNIPVSKLYGSYYIGLANGTVAIELDAQWHMVTPPASRAYWSTIQGFLNDSLYLPEWGDNCGEGYTQNSTDLYCYADDGSGDKYWHQTTDFSRIVFFFIFLAIVLAITNFFTGYDTAYPGAFIYIMTFIVVIMSGFNGLAGPGYFYLPGATYVNGYFAGFNTFLDNWILAFHFVLLSLIYFFTTNKRYQSG